MHYFCVCLLVETPQLVCVPFYPYNDLQKVGQVLITLIAALSQFTTIVILTIVITFYRIVKALRSSVINSSSLFQGLFFLARPLFRSPLTI